jgi:xanthine dehydrogenase accessory factor
MRTFFDKVMALRAERRPFATATVVGRRPPVSAHLGDRAIVYDDGRMEGFIGGACSREIVRRQALDAMRTRRARLVSIRPDAASETTDPEHVVVRMTCVSEGAVDVYVEPWVEPRRLVVVGTTPVADALTRLALAIDYEVVRVVDSRELADLRDAASTPGVSVAPLDQLDRAVRESGGDAAAIVASQGHYDEQALETILRAGTRYVGLVASRKRGATVKQYLKDAGLTGLDTIRNPAGLDLRARSAPEVALSILAEVVQQSPATASGFCGVDAPSVQTAGPANVPVLLTAIDPICHMEVEIAGAQHTAEVDGSIYYFCCAQCRMTFLENPSAFLTTHA